MKFDHLKGKDFREQGLRPAEVLRLCINFDQLRFTREGEKPAKLYATSVAAPYLEKAGLGIKPLNGKEMRLSGLDSDCSYNYALELGTPPDFANSVLGVLGLQNKNSHQIDHLIKDNPIFDGMIQLKTQPQHAKQATKKSYLETLTKAGRGGDNRPGAASWALGQASEE